MFRSLSAISGHGCPEKLASNPDGELRAVASADINPPEHLENPLDGADSDVIFLWEAAYVCI